MVVREAKYQDKEIIAGFQVAMALETENLLLDITIVNKGVEAVFDDRSKGTYFVAEKESKVVGSLLITYEWSDWRNGVVWWIQSVFINPEFRGIGIFPEMYRHILKNVKQDGHIRGIRLYVDKTNIKAQKVYNKLGMDGGHYSTFEWMKQPYAN